MQKKDRRNKYQPNEITYQVPKEDVEPAEKPIELVAVIIVLAIIVVILAPRFVGFVGSARVNSIVSDCKTISKAITLYYTNIGEWPDDTNLVPTYITELPENLILIPSDKGAFTLTTEKNGYSAAVDASGNIIIIKGGSASISDVNPANAVGMAVSGGKVVYSSFGSPPASEHN